MNKTPKGNRLHIGIYGRRNAGKSTLINSLTGQDTALVSDAPGTTTDPVRKAMELKPIGPVVFIDTAGFDDEGELGALRVDRTKDTLSSVDVAVIVVDGAALADHFSEPSCYERALDQEARWAEELKKRDIPVVVAVSKKDLLDESMLEIIDATIELKLGLPYTLVGCPSGGSGSIGSAGGIEELREALTKAVPEDFMREIILGGIVSDESLVLLVMPQDIQAPKGRLILPQVQTIRELLDKKCTTVCTAADGFERTLAALSRQPDLIITDSQVFGQVYQQKPEGVPLTSFSVLFAASKGDIRTFVEGAKALDRLAQGLREAEKESERRTEKEAEGHPDPVRILIAEACTHVPQGEDIGTVKIPKKLRKFFAENVGASAEEPGTFEYVEITNVRGNDFPDVEELANYDLIIHCGACMFNRRHVLSRIAAAQEAGVPITNYGVVLAKLGGILDKITIPAN